MLLILLPLLAAHTCLQERGRHPVAWSAPPFRHQPDLFPASPPLLLFLDLFWLRRSAAAIRELVSTPQFRHQLDLFSHALMTGQLDTSQVRGGRWYWPQMLR